MSEVIGRIATSRLLRLGDAAGAGGYLPRGVGADGGRGGLMRGNGPPAVASLPISPGVYRFRNAGDRVL